MAVLAMAIAAMASNVWVRPARPATQPMGQGVRQIDRSVCPMAQPVLSVEAMRNAMAVNVSVSNVSSAMRRTMLGVLSTHRCVWVARSVWRVSKTWIVTAANVSITPVPFVMWPTTLAAVATRPFVWVGQSVWAAKAMAIVMRPA